MKVEYLLSFVFIFLMVGAFFLGGVFSIIFIILVYLIFYYIIFKIARSLDGDAVLNFFGILFVINAIYYFGIILLLNLTDNWMVLLLNAFILSVGVILKFVQRRMVVTAALAAHTLLAIIGLLLGVGSGDMTFSPLITIAINMGLIIYVNVFRELTKQSPTMELMFPPELE
jgi:hypothetical protein